MSGDTFATQFYNLEGVHFNERKKNFSKLLQSTSKDLLQNVDIKPRNHLEHLFYIDVLIKARKVEPLIQVLKVGNPEFTSRILKQRWFFQEAFTNLSEEQIVNSFLPSLSYSLKMKVLKKIALTFSEERMDKIFDFIHDRYGMFVAQQFLFSCSQNKITQTLQTNSLALTVEQLKRFLQKDPELLKIYFKEFNKNFGKNYSDQDFINYIAWKHPDMYFELSRMLDSNIKVGRLTTKRILADSKEDVLADKEFLEHKFHLGVVTRKVQDLLIGVFPDNLDGFDSYFVGSRIQSYLKRYPKKKRFEVFESTFTKKYGVELKDNLDKIQNNLITYFSDQVALLQQWAEIHYKKEHDLTYIQYLKPELAFSTVKERMNLTGNKQDRATMLEHLIRCCHFSKDYSYYKKSLNYMCYRSRNEDEMTRRNNMDVINGQLDIELTDDQFWKHINEMVEVARANKDSLPFGLMAKYVVYCFRHNRPVEELMSQFVLDVVKEPAYVHFSKFSEFQIEPKLYGILLTYLSKNVLKILSDAFKNVHDERLRRRETSSVLQNLFKEILKFNDDPRNKDWKLALSECKDLKQEVQRIFSTESSDSEDITLGCMVIRRNYLTNYQRPLEIDWASESATLSTFHFWLNHPDLTNRVSDLCFDLMKPPRLDRFHKNMLDFYFTHAFKPDSNFTNQHKVVSYFIKHEPALFLEKFEIVLNLNHIKKLSLDYAEFRLFGHLGWDKALIGELTKRLQESDEKVHLLRLLSKLQKTEEFLKLIEPFIPDKPKLDVQDQQQKDTYELQCKLVNTCLVNLHDDYDKLIPCLTQFCQGDYLQSALRALYKTLYRIHEQEVESFVKVLMNRALSTRKHAVNLAFELLPEKTALGVFETLAGKEENDSAKKHLLRSVLKYFIKNPSDGLLALVIGKLTFVHPNDQELVHYLSISATNVAGKYRPTYCERIFYMLDEMRKRDGGQIVETYLKSLIVKMNSQVEGFYMLLSEEFWSNILENYFLSDSYFLDEIGEFVAKYLLAHNNQKCFTSEFNRLKRWKDLYWNSEEKQMLRGIFSFFSSAFRDVLHKDMQFLNAFKSHWAGTFTKEETPEQFILMDMLTIYKRHPDLHDFAREVNVYLKQTLDFYGLYFMASLNNTFSVFFNSNVEVGHNSELQASIVSLELLRIEASEFNALLATEHFDRFREGDREEIFKILKSVDKPYFRVKSNEFIKNFFF